MSTKKEPTADFELMTPAKASEILKNNKKNRHMRGRLLDHYVRQIQDGAWETNGEAVQLAHNGNLLNGQHRLEAIVKANKSVKLLVVRGLDESVRSTIDIGHGRSVGDVLKMEGIEATYGSRLAAAVAIVLKFRKGKFIDTKQRMTPREAMDFIASNKDIQKSLHMVVNQRYQLCMPSVIVACHFLFSRIDRYKAEDFFDKFATGKNLGSHSPILKIRGQMERMRAEKFSRRANAKPFLYLMCAAFDDFIHNRRIDGYYKFTANSLIELPKAK